MQNQQKQEAKAAALYMLKHGLGTVGEISELSGRSRQIVHHWQKMFRDARRARLERYWNRALKRSAD